MKDRRILMEKRRIAFILVGMMLLLTSGVMLSSCGDHMSHKEMMELNQKLIEEADQEEVVPDKPEDGWKEQMDEEEQPDDGEQTDNGEQTDDGERPDEE